jgi:hypothetical protein
MKAILIGTSVVLALSAWTLTTSAATPSAQAPAQATEPKPHDMTGCLAKGDTAGTYRLTDLEKGPKTVEIVEVGKDVQKVDAHLGHRVTITGVAVPAPKEGEKGHFMRMDAFKHVSPMCP